VQQVFPAVEENIIENIERMREVGLIYQEAIASQINHLIEKKGAEIHFPILKLQKHPALHTILWEICKQYGFAANQIVEIIKLMRADNGAFIASGSHRVIKNRNWLIIAQKASEDSLLHVIEAGEKLLEFEKGRLEFSQINAANLIADPTIALLDLSKIQFPLLVRKPRTGDYFYPLGMQKKRN